MLGGKLETVNFRMQDCCIETFNLRVELQNRVSALVEGCLLILIHFLNDRITLQMAFALLNTFSDLRFHSIEGDGIA